MTPLPPFQYMLCVCLQELFAAYDKDDSGTISFDELTEGLRAQGYVVNESEVGCGVQHTCMPAVALGDSVGWFPYVSCNMSSIICESRGRCL
jgi:hypothetical protein